VSINTSEWFNSSEKKKSLLKMPLSPFCFSSISRLHSLRPNSAVKSYKTVLSKCPFRDKSPFTSIQGHRFISDWARRHINDPYVRQSQKDGYRCRSAYKLLEIQERFELLEPGMTVMECGCAPGSWSQVAAKLVNAGGFYEQDKLDGVLVGCDLLRVEPVPGAILLSHRDFTDENAQKEMLEIIGKRETFDLVMSDMAPNASGIKSLDHERIISMALKVKDFALNHACVRSCLVIKVWQGGLLTKFIEMLKHEYQEVRHYKPKASRNDSAELYIIAQKLIKPRHDY